VPEVVPEYVASTSALERRFTAPIYYVLGALRVPFEDAKFGASQPKLSQPPLRASGFSSVSQQEYKM